MWLAASLCFKVKEAGHLRQKHVEVKGVWSLLVRGFQFPDLIRIFMSNTERSLHSV